MQKFALIIFLFFSFHSYAQVEIDKSSVRNSAKEAFSYIGVPNENKLNYDSLLRVEDADFYSLLDSVLLSNKTDSLKHLINNQESFDRLLHKKDSIKAVLNNSKGLDAKSIKKVVNPFFENDTLLDHNTYMTVTGNWSNRYDSLRAAYNMWENNLSDFEKIKAQSYPELFKFLTAYVNDSTKILNVYSKKEVIKKYDSLMELRSKVLSGFGLENPAKEDVKMTESEYLALLSNELGDKQELEADSLVQNSKLSLEEERDHYQSIVDQQKTRVDSIMSVRISDRPDLMPIPKKEIDSSLVSVLDSLTIIKTKVLDLNILQKYDSIESKVVTISEKKNFKDKLYFEGLFGSSSADLSEIRLSPALAFEFMEDLSLGIGPELNLFRSDSISATTTGIRTFIKKEFFEKRVYTQLEYSGNDVSEWFNKEKLNIDKGKIGNRLLIGGGILIPVYNRINLNVAGYYNLFNKSIDANKFNIRIGLSILK